MARNTQHHGCWKEMGADSVIGQQTARIKKCSPPSPDWMLFRVRMFPGMTDNYEEAKRWVKLFEEQSSVESEPKSRKRVRNHRYMSSSSDEVHTMLHKKPSSIDFRRVGALSRKEPQRCNFRGEFSTAQMDSRTQDQSTEFQRMVLQQLATINETQKEIMQMLRRLKSNESGALRGSLLDLLEPAKSENELQVMEDQLQDKEHQRKMTQYLSTVGGKDLADGVRRVMTAIATHSVWRSYSLHGKKGKKPLKNMTYTIQCHITGSYGLQAERHHVGRGCPGAGDTETCPARCKKVPTEAPATQSISPSDGDI
ncbi:hypothetical protein ANANG_G00065060 [Anguilla anguilla]|uniref:DUF4806 domain-containing protein n=1 Tax=Anguilla anguilla TaxID=7936 RepID=A0A9D3S5G7_ANGAN|nr:hypothetical protein ANANG_G00065060 [Anguilla anguilla]